MLSQDYPRRAPRGHLTDDALLCPSPGHPRPSVLPATQCPPDAALTLSIFRVAPAFSFESNRPGCECRAAAAIAGCAVRRNISAVGGALLEPLLSSLPARPSLYRLLLGRGSRCLARYMRLAWPKPWLLYRRLRRLFGAPAHGRCVVTRASPRAIAALLSSSLLRPRRWAA